MGAFNAKGANIYQLHVEGMTCDGCINGVKRAVQAVDDSAELKVDRENKTVQVTSHVGIDAVRTAIYNAGYPVINAVEV